MGKLSDVKKRLSHNEKLEGKEDVLEKGDFQALLIASMSVFGPVLLGMLVFFGIIILIINLVWK